MTVKKTKEKPKHIFLTILLLVKQLKKTFCSSCVDDKYT